MNTPSSNFLRRQGTLRGGVFLPVLLVGLLAPISLAWAQTPATPQSGNTNGLTAAASSAFATDSQPDLAEFSVWAGKYAKAQSVAGAASEPDAATLAEGVRLAERRRMVLAALMHTDPARALAVGIPAAVRAKLPASVLSRLETPFSTVGDYAVDERSGRREITFNDHSYTAHVSGAQLALTSLRNVSLSGFVLDGEAVLDASTSRPGTPVARIQARRAPQPQTIYGNDPFSGALQLFDNAGSIADDNLNATKEAGEPDHAFDPGGASVWYTWTPTNSGVATFTTDDGLDHFTVDTLLAVYTGMDVANLSRVVSNDDTIGYNSQVTFDARAGVTYHIAVDGYLYFFGPSEGNYTLTYFQQGDPNSPSITSDTTLDVEVNNPVLYSISATNNPTFYSATGLPGSLSIDTVTGRISGTPTEIGSYTVIISATNGFGTGSAGLTLTVTDHPVHIPFFTGEVVLPQSPGVYYLHLRNGEIFGFYSYLDDPAYIYHFDLGYEYTFDAADGKSGIYLYDFASDTFFYTSPRYPFPYLYDFKLRTVVYYYPDRFHDGRFNVNGTRYFYNFATGQVISK